jgi:hypothetical protein
MSRNTIKKLCAAYNFQFVERATALPTTIRIRARIRDLHAMKPLIEAAIAPTKGKQKLYIDIETLTYAQTQRNAESEMIMRYL